MTTGRKAARGVGKTVPTERGEIIDDKVYHNHLRLCISQYTCAVTEAPKGPGTGGNAFESSHLFVSPDGIRGGCTLEKRAINHPLYDAKAGKVLEHSHLAYAIDNQV